MKKRLCKIISDDKKIKGIVSWPGQASNIPLAVNDNGHSVLNKNKRIKIITSFAIIFGAIVSFMLVKFSTRSIQANYLAQEQTQQEKSNLA